MFREAATNGDTTNLEEYTSSVTSYISKCIDDVTVSRSITTRPNQKPWTTAKVLALLKSRDSDFRAGDKDALRIARAKLSRAIREARRTHSQRIHGHFQGSGDTWRMWQGIQSITDYSKEDHPSSKGPDALSHHGQCEENAELTHGKLLTDVFTNIFNISLSSAIVLMCLKTTIIIPVPKKSPVSCLNDYHPVALTPIIMKCFERLVMRHIKNLLPPSVCILSKSLHG
ncbi:hypothetical protein QTP86_023319 [Hemibagrus guttatus]|nr:hypothetical protein QTP86_023319 [Hemibagrus guttatus]